MKYTIKKLTNLQRAKVTDHSLQGNIGQAAYFACTFGLESLNNEIITSSNVESKIEDLSFEEIIEIGTKIIEDSNFSKKKKSR